MPSVSPIDASEGVLGVTLRCRGEALDAALSIVSLVIRREVQEIPSATVVLHLAGPLPGVDPDDNPLRIAPGDTLEILAGVEETRHTLFAGQVVSRKLRLNAQDGPDSATLAVECRDPALRMDQRVAHRVWSDCTDSELFARLIGDHGLVASVAADPFSAEPRETVVQPGCSDWALLRARAQTRGLWVVARDGTLRVGPPDVGAKAVATFEWGVNVLEFEAERDGTRDGALQGRARLVGSALAAAGAVVQFAGVGALYSGKTLLTAVEHTLSQGGWFTEVRFGALRTDAAAAPKGTQGLHLGEVLRVHGDPEGAHRIFVRVPTVGMDGLWARLARVQASPSHGVHFLPQPGDDVLVGWLHDDPGQPVVLGSVHSPQRPPPHEAQPGPAVSALVSAGRSTLEFDDRSGTLALRTAGGREVTLSDGPGQLRLADAQGNEVVMDGQGLRIASAGDLHLKCQGRLTLEALDGATLKSVRDVDVQGLNVRCQAQIGFAGHGATTAEVTSTGLTTVKGALVLVN